MDLAVGSAVDGYLEGKGGQDIFLDGVDLILRVLEMTFGEEATDFGRVDFVHFAR